MGIWTTGRSGNAPGQGPFLDVHLRAEGGRIAEARYETYPCPACHECGKAVCSLALGLPVEEARGITWEKLVSRVGPLPRPREPSAQHERGEAEMLRTTGIAGSRRGFGTLATRLLMMPDRSRFAKRVAGSRGVRPPSRRSR